MHIIYVSDAKAGHRSQALGLYQAMQRQMGTALSFEELSIESLPIFSLVKAIFQKKCPLISKTPDYIVGVGSHTQFRVLLLGRVYAQAKTIILMKPNYPYSWFDHVVIPAHDGVPEQGNVILSMGALNPIVNQQRHQSNRILIALGGSSKRHQWNEKKVKHAISRITEQNPHAVIVLTSSRRTPSAFLEAIAQEQFAARLEVYSVEQTASGWIFEQMQQAEAVWITEDSVSMLFEALTAGCKVGVIEVDRLKQDRITQVIDDLIEKKIMIKTYCVDDLDTKLELREADRVAKQILNL